VCLTKLRSNLGLQSRCYFEYLVPQYNLELQFRCYIDEVNVNGVDFSMCV